MKKYCFLFLVGPMLLSCSMKTNTVQAANENATPFEFSITSPQDGQVLEILNDTASAFLEQYTSEDSITSSANYYISGYDLYYQKPINITWSVPSGYQYFLFNFADNEDLLSPITYLVNDPEINIEYDFYANTTYFYQIDAYYSDHLLKSKVFSFITKDTIRTLNIEGISNTRDFGGMRTIDGTHRIKQGIVFRGANIDNIKTPEKDYMLNRLGIKTDVDLRRGGEGLDSSPLGVTTYKFSTGCAYYTGSETGIAGSAEYRASLLGYLKAFTIQENYPIYFHCAVGRDRTGTIGILLDALLGISRLDTIKQFEFSVLSYSGSYDLAKADVPNWVRNGVNTVNYLQNYSSGTLQQNTEAFLLDLGLTQSEINNIKSIMLEEI